MGEHKKKQNNYKEAYNCGLTSVTDDLFVPSALPPYTNTHSSYQVKLHEIYTKIAKLLKKGAAYAKKRQHAHKFALNFVIKTFAIILQYHHSHFWATTLDFTTFSCCLFCMGHTFFTAWLYLSRYNYAE